MDSKYKDVDPDIIAFHKLASMYGWTWQEFRATPYPVLKQLLDLLARAGE